MVRLGQATAVTPSHRATSAAQRDARVLILCGDAAGNLGDRAIVRAMCQAIREANGDVALTVSCADASCAERHFQASAVGTGARGWVALWRCARRSTMVVCGGGGLFQDDDSLVKMPYWAVRVAVARLACPRVAGVSLGVGPLSAAGSRAMGRVALRRLEPVSVRDPIARELASKLAGRAVDVVPDPAFMLRSASRDAADASLAEHGVPLDGTPLIGVALRRWFPPRRRLVPHKVAWRMGLRSRGDEAMGQRYAALLARALDRIAERTGGHIVFMPSYNLPHEGDDMFCEQVIAGMSSRRFAMLRLDDPALYKAVAARLSVMIGGRMHPTIFAAGAGTPIVGLAYNPKFFGLFKLLEVRNRAIDVGAFVHGRQVDRLVNLVDDAMQGQPGLAERAEALGERTRAHLHRLVRTMA